MRVELLRGAEADLLENYVRLEEARGGLGDRFYRMLDSALERLRKHPESAAIYREPSSACATAFPMRGLLRD